MEQTNQLNALKQQAELNAFKKLQFQFSTYEQLEQIEQHMSKNEKRKVNLKLFKKKSSSMSKVTYFFLLHRIL